MNRPGVKVLDVGCGNHSPRKTKTYYPRCEHYGLDRSRSYELDSEDFGCMHRFYEVDLACPSQLEIVPNGFFDCLVLSHVIEHLPNSDTILRLVSARLREPGVMYVEFPSLRSVRLPSARGTLNFYDDSTHVKLHSLSEVRTCLVNAGLRIVKSGVRRSPRRILLLPVYAAVSLLTKGYVAGPVWWDVTGFADYVIATRAGPGLHEPGDAGSRDPNGSNPT